MKTIAIALFLVGCSGATLATNGCGDEYPIPSACPQPSEPVIAISPGVEVVSCKNGDHCIQTHGDKYCQSHCY